MKKLITKWKDTRPVALCILLLLISTAVIILITIPIGIISTSVVVDSYVMQLIVEVAAACWVIYLLRCCQYQTIYRERGRGIFSGFVVGGYMTFIILLLMLTNCITILNMETATRQPISRIIAFSLTMFMIGFMEESLFRGVLANLIFQKYSSNVDDVRYSVLMSGIIFGLFHLSNAIGGVINIVSVLIQVVCTAALGMFLTAIYFRTRNIWTVIILHAVNDFAALFVSACFSSADISDSIDGISPLSLISILPHVIATIIIMRRSKINEILEQEKLRTIKTSNSECSMEMNSKIMHDGETNRYDEANVYAEANGYNEVNVYGKMTGYKEENIYEAPNRDTNTSSQDEVHERLQLHNSALRYHRALALYVIGVLAVMVGSILSIMM